MGKGGTFTFVAIMLLILGGLAVFIAWLADKMKCPTISIEQGALNDYNFSTNNLFNATFTFIVRSYNPDPKYNIKYHVVAVSVYHNDDYALGFETLGQYTQGHREDLVFTARPVARDVFVSDANVAEAIRAESSVGKLKLEIRVRAAVRYEIIGWKHKHYILSAICFPVVMNLNSGKTFGRINCDLNRFI